MVMTDDKRVRFFFGNVRDKDHLACALNRIDYAVHAVEYKPLKCVKTVVANQIAPTLIGCRKEMRSMG